MLRQGAIDLTLSTEERCGRNGETLIEDELVWVGAVSGMAHRRNPLPVSIGDEKCEDPGRQYRVSLRIYNILSQLVAIPVLQGGAGNLAGRPLDKMLLTCGDYVAYWDGKYMGTKTEVASGVYLYELRIDNDHLVRRMLVTK